MDVNLFGIILNLRFGGRHRLRHFPDLRHFLIDDCHLATPNVATALV